MTKAAGRRSEIIGGSCGVGYVNALVGAALVLLKVGKLRRSDMIKLATVALGATLGLAALANSQPAAAGVSIRRLLRRYRSLPLPAILVAGIRPIP
jgi:hypothetical protein